MTDGVSLQTYLVVEVLRLAMVEGLGTTVFEAVEAVASTAIEHPEWPPLSERRTWDEWRAWNS